MTDSIGLLLVLIGSTLVYLGMADWVGKGIPGMIDTVVERMKNAP